MRGWIGAGVLLAGAVLSAASASAAQLIIRDAVVEVRVVPQDRDNIEVHIERPNAKLPLKVEEAMRLEGADVTSQQVGLAVLEHLRSLDEVAYLRFASVYKDFADVGDFEREVGLLTKSTEPKHHE